MPSNTVRNIIAVIILVGVGYAVVSQYLAANGPVYRDRKYGFTVGNQRGWGKPKQTGAYYMRGTPDSTGKTVVSSFNVNPVPKNGTAEQKRSTFAASCADYSRATPDNERVMTDTGINGIPGYTCSYTGRPEHVDAPYEFRLYLLTPEGPGAYDYAISVSYPKDNPKELRKVTDIVGSFGIL